MRVFCFNFLIGNLMKRAFLRTAAVVAFFGISASLVTSPALALEAPKGKLVLTFSGNISVKNQGDKAVLDVAMIEKLPQKTMKTNTPWYKEPRTFTGPLMRDVLKLVGVKGKQLKMVAIDDYRTVVPVSDSNDFDVILATKMNGKNLEVMEKGPFFMIYPFDTKEELKSVKYYERSVWQIKDIIVE
jgi:hypothetical protein